MNRSVKHYFGLNEINPSFQALTSDEKVLVKEGHKIAKMYQLAKATKSDNKDFMSVLDDVKTEGYNDANGKFVEAIVRYSLDKAGVDTTNFTMDQIRNPQLNSKTIFRETFNAVIAQILTPMTPAIASATFSSFADTANVNWGETARFIVRSNDTFYVTRIAEGVLTGTTQRLYNRELTVNPESYSIKTTVDWYHVAAGLFDFGHFVDRIGVSFNAYITQMIVQAISSDITTNINASSPYFTNGFTTAKWASLVDKLEAANGGAQVSAFGTRAALAAVIPNQVGLQMGLGEEWASAGHIYDYFGVPLVRIPEILLPNTVNTTALVGIPESTIYLFASAGYKPVKLVFEGQAVTKDFIPTETADKEMGVEVTMRMGQTFVSASRYGAITSVSLS
jgi:hypothetical protein